MAMGSTQLQFSSPNYAVDENSENAVLTVKRVGSASGQVSVQYATQDGSATAGSDYVSQNRSLTWADGDSQNKTIRIPILRDSEPESEETVIIQLFNVNGAAILGTIDQAVLKILDEIGSSSSGMLAFTETEYSVSESVGNITVNVERLQGMNNEITVDYLTRNGTASAGEDYILTQGTLTWVAGESGVKSFTIPILADELSEDQENFTVILTNPTGNADLSASAAVATITINDGGGDGEPNDNPAGVLQFDMSTYDVLENDGSVTISVTRLNGTQGIVSIDYNTQDGTAVSGNDYLAHQGTLTWEDGESGSKSFTVDIVDNDIAESAETLILQLSNLQGGPALGSQHQAILTIHDDDNRFIKLSGSAYVENENSDRVIIDVQREGDAFGEISVYYQTVDDISADFTATAGEDYESTQGRLIWESGDVSNKTFTIPLINDNLTEGNEDIYIRLFSPEGAQLVEPFEAKIKLMENDGSVCSGGEEINCYFVNTGILNNVRILSQGTVVGGELSGEISNDGVVENVVLTAQTKLTGGIVYGSISSDPDNLAILNNDPNYLAILNDVDVAAGTTLSNIIVGYNSHVSDNVTLGEGVFFRNNASIPSVNLNTVLGRKDMSVFGLHAIDLTRDILLPGIIGGILSAINGLHEFSSHQIDISQNPIHGILRARIEGLRYTALPIRVKQMSRQQATAATGLSNLGVSLDSDDRVTFETHTDRRIIAQPVIQDPDFFKESLANTFGLSGITMLANGNLRTPVRNSIYYIGRANLFARQVEEQSVGVSLNSYGNVSFIYQDDSSELDDLPELWEQIIFPVAVDSDALYNLSTETRLSDGKASIKLLERIYKGMFDFAVTTGEPPTSGKVQIMDIVDQNGDGYSDYKIIYPNGDRQTLFKLPQF